MNGRLCISVLTSVHVFLEVGSYMCLFYTSWRRSRHTTHSSAQDGYCYMSYSLRGCHESILTKLEDVNNDASKPGNHKYESVTRLPIRA